MRAGIYGRYSTDEQDKASTDDQLRVGRAFAAGKGWPVVAEYVDEAISGVALGNRPGVQAAIADAYAGKYDVLIVIELARLSRSEDLPKLIQRLKFRNVRVIGVQDGFDSTARTARMQAGMASIMGAEFVEMIGSRVHSSLQMRALEGKPTGGRSYGYGKDHLPCEPESSIVREVFERFSQGESMKAIATDLNARAIPSPGASWKRKTRRQDGRWLVSGVHTILHNDAYTGRVVWNRRQFRKDPDTGKRRCVERPKSEWIEHHNPNRVIVSAAVWEECQKRLGVIGSGPKNARQPRYLLSGLLVCGSCGSKMVIYGGKQHRYICGTFHGGGAHACDNTITVPRTIAEERICGSVIAEMTSDAAVQYAAECMRAELRREQIKPATTPDLERVEAEIADLRKIVQTGVLTAARAAPSIEAAERELEAIKRELRKQIAGGGTISFTTAELAATYRAHAKQLRETIQGQDIFTAREALRAHVGDVKCVPSGRHLTAVFSRGVFEFLQTGTGVDKLVAGVGFEPTTFGL
jgi:site-specific DNA recombinase